MSRPSPGPSAKLVGEKAALGLVDADHRAIRTALGEEPALGGEIAAHPAMPVEVVGGEVGEDRDIGGERAGELDLVGAELQHDHRALPRRVDVENAAADVPGEFDGHPGALEEMRDQGRGGGLAVRPRHRDDAGRRVEGGPFARGERAEEEADVVVHRDAGLHRRGDDAVRLRVEMRDAGRGDQAGDAEQRVAPIGSATVKPSASAAARPAAPSSQASTSAPPARSARAADRPERPSPSTATLLPLETLTGIMHRPPSVPPG
jgi:hypothetical protein